MFSWFPFYRELTQKVLQFEDKQSELIALMEKMRAAKLPVMFLEENLPDGTRALLTKIDPFTFVMNFNITTSENARQLCVWLKKEWNMGAAVPADFAGLPWFPPVSPWFFPAIGDGRGPDDITKLWQLARNAWDSTAVDANLYSECLKIKYVALAKLTTGLFWFSPQGFLPINAKTLKFLKARGLNWDDKRLNKGSYDEYKSLIQKSHDITYNHAELTHKAWEADTNPDIIPPAEPLDFPLNLILYGPPGTGKTYNTISRAVEIVDSVELERAEAVARFEELRAEHRIGFVTFHQSYAYEEFIEGLRPDVDENARGGASYSVRAGTLKTMALRALGACLERAQPESATFNDVWNAFERKIEENPDFVLPGVGPSQYKVSFTAAGAVMGDNTAGNAQQPYTASLSNIEKAWSALRNGPTATHNAIYAVLKKGSHTNLIGAIIEELKRLEAKIQKNIQTPVDLVAIAQSYLKGSGDYQLKADLTRVPRYVLIVDEINRGNISKILGELITLLEDDKRLGAENALRVILPYSGETFALPPNLYLIGTMNTADKSLALLDVALRRRFVFEEMAPDFSPDVCPDLPAEMRDVVREMNRRLLRVLDREHRLGHAFFIKVQDKEAFNEVFRLKIVPLLQEFFYNDWENLRSVLGETGVGKIVRELKDMDGVRGRNLYGWWSDEDSPEPDFLEELLTNYKMKAPNPVAVPADSTVAETTASEGA